MCPCCKNIEWKEVEGYICGECSYRYIAVKELGTCSPAYCEECGVTYSNGCNLHEADKQKPIKF